MTVDPARLKQRLELELREKAKVGFDVAGLERSFRLLSEDYEDISHFASELSRAGFPPVGPYVEPDDLAGILRESDPQRSLEAMARLDQDEVARRVAGAFGARLCGCMLGKPFEGVAGLAEIEAAGIASGDWPLTTYVSEGFLDALGYRHPSWRETVRERLRYVAADDDINYSLIALMVLEQHGAAFTKSDLAQAWFLHLPLGWTYGAERAFLAKLASHQLGMADEPIAVPEDILGDWVERWNPESEHCGAMIRADAYGYASPGNPSLASRLAWRDASLSHRKTGVYAAMFVAAAIASAAVVHTPKQIIESAMRYIPQHSRLREVLSQSLELVCNSESWGEAYDRIHDRYAHLGFCRVYWECATLVNSVLFAHSVEEGICIQASQGGDTDSMCATVGSILGMFYVDQPLPDRWTRPLNDEVRTGLAGFSDRSMRSLCDRMGRLSKRLGGG